MDGRFAGAGRRATRIAHLHGHFNAAPRPESGASPDSVLPAGSMTAAAGRTLSCTESCTDEGRRGEARPDRAPCAILTSRDGRDGRETAVGIRDRIKFIARSYLNSLRESARASASRPDPDIVFEDDEEPVSDEEFEKRWQEFAKDRVEDARQRDRERAEPPPRKRSGERTMEQCYQNLECPVGADLKTVRAHFRRLMKKYHPDLHTANKRQQDAANRISQIITESYQQIEKHLQAKGQK
jgi:DnaJ-domain-containing protein 1